MPRHRRHVVLTVWPIFVLFALTLVRAWPAVRGARSYAAALPATWLSLIVSTVVVTVLLGAYGHGWRTLALRSVEDFGPYRSAGCIRLQKLAGAVAWALVVAHLILCWAMTMHTGPVALSHYELMRGYLSRPLVVASYVLGIAAFGLFASQGLAASFRAWRIGERPKGSLGLEVGATLASALMVMIAFNVLSHFATGRAYWTGPSSPAPPSAAGFRGRAP